TLWEIALATRPDSSVSPQQMMIALQDVNPDAFINGNINRLKTHTVLDIPDASIIETVNNREAVAEVVRQNRELKAGVAQIDATGRKNDAPAPRKSTGNGEVRLLASQADGDANQSGGSVSGAAGTRGAADTDLAIALENLDKSQRENQELVDRLSALEEQLAKMERLIALQNDQLASMQAESANNAAKPEEAAANAPQDQNATSEAAGDAVAANQAVEETTQQEQPTTVSESAVETDDTAPSEAENTEVSESGAEVAGTEGQAAVAEGDSSTEGGSAETDYNYSEQTDAALTAPVASETAEQKAMAERAAAEARKAASQSNQSIVDKILAVPYEYLAIAAGLLLTLIVLVLRLRARKEEEAVAAAEKELAAEDVAASGAALDDFDQLDGLNGPEGDDLPDFEESALADNNESEFGDFDLGNDDPTQNIESDLADIDLDAYEDADAEYETVGQTEDALSESDIYIAYGKFDQAIELLKGAIAAEPERTDLRLKQLEVLSSLDDAQAFAESESDLIALSNADANAAAAELRMQLSNPVEPEIRADDALSLDGDLPSLDDSAEGEFDDGMDFGAALDFGDDVKPEDDGIGAKLETVPELELGESSDFDAEGEGVNMSLEDEAPELDDELLNFDMEDSDQLESDESDSLAELDSAPALDIEAEDSAEEGAGSFELDEELVGDLEELPAADLSDEPELEAGLDFSTDEFELDEEGLTAALEENEAPVTDASVEVKEEDDLSLDFELDEPVAVSDELDDLLDESEPGVESLDALVEDGTEDGSKVDAVDSIENVSDALAAEESDDDLPELTFDVDTDGAESVDLADLSFDQNNDQDSDLTAEAVQDEVAPDDAPVALEDIELPSDSVSAEAPDSQSDEPEASTDEDSDASDELEGLMSMDADDLAENSDLIGGIDLDELAAADDEFDFLAGTDECATKLDLAQAYVDMEDVDGAKELLQEVIQEGNDAQKQEAKDLMDKLS
ncbi:MAG: FimV/HubP family polar landmark protein, partial [Pseudomonadota bacterium]|nr:FimV/HubP family polar landmark protein [Pseudomonadota bacterium]